MICKKESCDRKIKRSNEKNIDINVFFTIIGSFQKKMHVEKSTG